ncbi:hypothetical protein CY34DRAFT_804566, partial [Suillus luteus UH-Slu-Lm8-n1]
MTALAKHWYGLRLLEDPRHVSRITYGVFDLDSIQQAILPFKRLQDLLWNASI